jgi:thiamine-phosphate pyrophosphorylase
VIVDPEHTNGRSTADVTREAVAGGAAAIQLRDKLNDKGKVLEAAREIRDICDDAGALFIANDDADVALLSKAHGLHVGQKDLPLAEARRVVGPAQIIGVSNALYEEAIATEWEGADYVAVGTIYDTASKSETRSAGLETLRQVADTVTVPIVAIGGINESNIAIVLDAGADSICVLSAVTSASDPRAASAKLAEMIDKAA